MNRDHQAAEVDLRAAVNHLIQAKNRLGNDCAAYGAIEALIEETYDAERRLYECPHRDS